MRHRKLSLFDRVIGEIDSTIRVLSGAARAARAFPGAPGGEIVLNDAEILEAARLMRVNHAGEVAAQALYQGQALTARDPGVVAALQASAREERDHLAWCERRIGELRGRTSVLNPLWYAGSFGIGALAGALGDAVSLGFIVETEKQVEAHLHGHLTRLPAGDTRSRALLEQMTRDEAAHAAKASALGGRELPISLRFLMRMTSKLMTRGSYWL